MDKLIEWEKGLEGIHISSACKDAVDLANKESASVHFVFNDVDVTARPGDNPQALMEKWDTDREAKRQAWLASPEYKKREEERVAEEKRKREAHIVEAAKTENEMREAKEPWPYTMEQLVEYINSLVNRDHDYGTCVYAMSLAAAAAFNYVSHQLGVTGFQASCADLDFLRRTRGMKGPFIILKAEDAVYPQYDLRQKLEKFLFENREWVRDQARKNIAEDRGYPVSQGVMDHWEKLANEKLV